jgi:hypothetical protein
LGGEVFLILLPSLPEKSINQKQKIMNESAGCTPPQSELVSFLNNFDARVTELNNVVIRLGELASKLKPIMGKPSATENKVSPPLGLVGDCLTVLDKLSNTHTQLLDIYDHLNKLI